MADTQIFVYPHDCTDFRDTGLVGDLQPVEATFTEEKNGTSEIVLKLPIDKLQKWKACQNGNIIRCPVPVRVPPVIQDDQYADTVQIGE